MTGSWATDGVSNEREATARFPEAFKREAVERVATSGLPIVRVAEELGLHETVLKRSMRQEGAEGTAPQWRFTTQAALRSDHRAARTSH